MNYKENQLQLKTLQLKLFLVFLELVKTVRNELLVLPKMLKVQKKSDIRHQLRPEFQKYSFFFSLQLYPYNNITIIIECPLYQWFYSFLIKLKISKQKATEFIKEFSRLALE